MSGETRGGEDAPERLPQGAGPSSATNAPRGNDNRRGARTTVGDGGRKATEDMLAHSKHLNESVKEVRGFLGPHPGVTPADLDQMISKVEGVLDQGGIYLSEANPPEGGNWAQESEVHKEVASFIFGQTQIVFLIAETLGGSQGLLLDAEARRVVYGVDAILCRKGVDPETPSILYDRYIGDSEASLSELMGDFQ